MVLEDQMAVPAEEIAGKLNALGRETILLGDGSLAYREQLAELLTIPYSFALPHLHQQRASSVAVCAMEYVRQGKVESAAAHQPDYLRVSQAERERAKRLQQEQEARQER